MQSRWKYVQITVSSLALMMPGFLCGDTIYTYSGDGVDLNFELTINPDSIPPGTDVNADILPGSFSTTFGVPATDEAGFSLGDNAFDLVPPVEIGTNSVGDITSWDITGTEFASYPAFVGENPLDFFCDYSVTFSPSGGSGPLSKDNDAGFCPSSTLDTAANVMNWSHSAVTTTPEPSNSALIGGGLLCLAALVTRRKRAAIAR